MNNTTNLIDETALGPILDALPKPGKTLASELERLKSEAKTAWDALESYKNSPQYIEAIMRQSTLREAWVSIYMKIEAIKSLLE